MYPIDWLVNLLTPGQWTVILIVVTLITAIGLPVFAIKRISPDPDESGWTIPVGLLGPALLGAVVGGIFHFISFLVWLWIGSPG
jgi:hypothetical protein